MPEAILIRAGFEKPKIISFKKDSDNRFTEIVFLIRPNKHYICHKAIIEHKEGNSILSVEEFK
jgi:hypothetical protein